MTLRESSCWGCHQRTRLCPLLLSQPSTCIVVCHLRSARLLQICNLLALRASIPGGQDPGCSTHGSHHCRSDVGDSERNPQRQQEHLAAVLLHLRAPSPLEHVIPYYHLLYLQGAERQPDLPKVRQGACDRPANTLPPQNSARLLVYLDNRWCTMYHIFAIPAPKSLSACNYPLLQKLFSSWLSTQTTSNIPLIN